jgi:RNA polymerase sigma factor (sigma-70 family)
VRPNVGRWPPSLSRFEGFSDELLIKRLRDGESRAFEAIYDRYERPIRSFCRHMLGQPEDADDAAQHTFLAAYRELVGSEKEIDLRPWLFTIARNRCRTLLRARYRGLAFCESMEYEPSVEGLSVEVERREQLRDLMRDIARLPEDQRAALLLTQLDTLRHDEVARVLEVPAEKVKALVFQARSSLVASELARETPCREIREQLATLTGAGLRRRTLRRHVRDCAGCREFELELRRQHRAILVLLPVAASPAVRSAVAAHMAGGAAGGGGAAAGGGAIAGGGGAAGAGGGGISSLVVNAIAMKTATALSVVVAGAGVVAVTTHTPAGRQAVADADAATDARELGMASTQIWRPPQADPGSVQPRDQQALRHAPPHPGGDAHRDPPPPPPGGSHESPPPGAPAVPADGHPPSSDKPKTAPVSDKQDKGKKDAGAGDQGNQGQAGTGGTPNTTAPGQVNKQDPAKVPPGQAKKQESQQVTTTTPTTPAADSVPPGQAKDKSDKGNGNGNGSGNGNGNGKDKGAGG